MKSDTEKQLKNQEKVIGPNIHCSPVLTRTLSNDVEGGTVMEEKIIELLLNECKSIVDEHNGIEAFPQNHIIKYCSSKKFDLEKCFSNDSLKTWMYENFIFCEVDNSEKANTSMGNTFFENGQMFFGVDLNNMTAYLFYGFGRRWGSALRYKVSVGEHIELSNRELIGMF